MIEIANDVEVELHPRICVIGVGGGGGNAVANMIRHHVPGVEFVVANTDAQALNASPAMERIQLGRDTTQGLGAGSVATVGAAAAQEAMAAIEFALEGAHLCFIAAGMGGGTGTGAAPVIAAAARARGILTVGVVTKPFGFEGRRRAAAAEAGIEALREHVDTLIVIPNQNLFRVADRSTTIREAFAMADAVLEQGVRSITDLIVMPGIINLDFNDVRTVMAEMGKAMLGTGEAWGENRAIEAAEMAISNPLLDGDIAGARGLIISIAGGDDMRLMEVDEAANHIKNLVDPEADIIWGSSLDPSLEGRMRVSIVATGIDGEAAPAVNPATMAAMRAAARPYAPRIAPPPVEALPPPRPILPVFAPVVEIQASNDAEPIAAEPAAPAQLGEILALADLDPYEEELCLTANLRIEPEAADEPGEPAAVEAPRALSLFQRMAMLASRSAERAALEAQPAEPEEPGVYRRRAVGRGN